MIPLAQNPLTKLNLQKIPTENEKRFYRCQLEELLNP